MSNKDPWDSIPNLTGMDLADLEETRQADPSRMYPAASGGGGVDNIAGRIGNMPRCKIARTAALSIPTATLVSIIWDTTAPSTSCYDTDGMWSAALPTQIFAKTPGLYAFMAQLYYQVGSTAGGYSYRQVYFQHAQTGRVHAQAVVPPCFTGGVGTCIQIASHIPMNAGESVIVQTAHNDATTPLGLNVTADSMWVQATLISTFGSDKQS